MLALVYVFLVSAMLLGLPAYAYFGKAIDCFYCAEEMRPVAVMTFAIIIWLVTSGTSVRIAIAKVAFGEKFHRAVFAVAIVQNVANTLALVYFFGWLVSLNV